MPMTTSQLFVGGGRPLPFVLLQEVSRCKTDSKRRAQSFLDHGLLLELHDVVWDLLTKYSRLKIDLGHPSAWKDLIWEHRENVLPHGCSLLCEVDHHWYPFLSCHCLFQWPWGIVPTSCGYPDCLQLSRNSWIRHWIFPIFSHRALCLLFHAVHDPALASTESSILQT